MRRVQVTMPFLALLLRGQTREAITDDVPEDVRVIAVLQDTDTFQRATVWLLCDSTEWEPVAEGQTIPKIEPVYRTVAA